MNPETKADHIHPIELRDARFFAAPKNDEAALQALANIVLQHVRDLKGTLSEIHPFASTEWYGTTPLGSTCFVGRIPEMWKLHSILHAGDVAKDDLLDSAAAAFTLMTRIVRLLPLG